MCTWEGGESGAGATQATHPEKGVEPGQDLTGFNEGRERVPGSGFRVCQEISEFFFNDSRVGPTVSP